MLSLLGRIRMTRPLEPLEGLLLYLVQLVHMPQQRWIHVSSRKLGHKMIAPIIQAHACLLPQGPLVHEPGDLVLLEETETPSLTLMLLLLIRELLQEG